MSSVAVMVHAEISEAVEEWREGNPLVYGTCALAAEGCKLDKFPVLSVIPGDEINAAVYVIVKSPSVGEEIARIELFKFPVVGRVPCELRGLPPLKYIVVTERGKKGGRIHHHITVNGGIDRDELESLWGLGYANSRRLQFTENGLAGLAH